MTAELIDTALRARASLISQLGEDGTDCFRLFHGVSEGRPGLTVDRYGPVLLFQTWREALTPSELATLHGVVEKALGCALTPVWNPRGRGAPPQQDVELPDPVLGRELGLRYHVTPRHRGQDPLLFLDFRAGRRKLRERSGDKSVLNLFAYTGGAGLAAAASGATEVWNVDFAGSSLEWAARNLELNPLPRTRMRLVKEDVLPVVRQLAGLGVKGRGKRRRRFRKFEPRTFDIVVLDPPRWSKSAFGAVDIVRDYPSLLKPAMLATSPSGSLLLTNHAPEVSLEAWRALVMRTGEKCGRSVVHVETFGPEADFPSFDGAPPLKLAWVELS